MRIERILLGELGLSSADLKIHQVNICEKTRSCEVEVLVKEALSPQKQGECLAVLKDIVPTNFELSLKMIKNHTAEDVIAKKVRGYISTQSSFLKTNNGEGDVVVSKNGEGFVVCYNVGERFFGYFKTAIEEGLKKYLHRCFLHTIKLEVVAVPDYEERQIRRISTVEKKKGIDLENIEVYIGKKVELAPAFISEVDRESSFVIVCGVVENLKRIDIKNPRPNRNDHFFVFNLVDVSGNITCKIFQAKKYNQKVAGLDGKEIVLMGKSENNPYSKDIEIVATDISTCEIPKNLENPKEVSKPVPEFYSEVFPEELELYSQNNMLEAQKEIPQIFVGKRIVCFDLETTGLDPRMDTIIEIGGVEMVDGVITRKFSTLVNPERELPEIITQITGIKDEDLQDQPTIDMVMGDFFKFCDGAILCGHNAIGFDMKFVHSEAEKLGYIFGSKVIDTLEIARKNVQGVSNYKLGTLCAHYKIDLTNAHRAYHDAIATAQLLLEIYK